MPERAPTLQAKILQLLLPAICLLSAVSGAIVYNQLYGAILGRFEAKLTTISALVGVLIDPADHDALVSMIGTPGFRGPEAERGEVYRRQIEPMRTVRRKLGLTYLYTQVLGGRKDVMYVLDGTEGPEHTTVGYEDELPAETVRALRSINSRGNLYVSPIEQQEVWGLLKTAAAPVWSQDGRIVGSVGADVNIGIIHKSTENALLISGLLGGLSMIMAAVAASLVVGRVSRPLAEAKRSALQIAVGRFDLVRRDGPRSGLASLSGELADMADVLESRQAQQASVSAALAEKGLEQQLLTLIRRRVPDGVAGLDASGRGTLMGLGCTLLSVAPPPLDEVAFALWQERLGSIIAAGCARESMVAQLRCLGGSFVLRWPASGITIAVGIGTREDDDAMAAVRGVTSASGADAGEGCGC